MSDDSFEHDSFDELKPGDFLYQSDQELFLVVMAENEDSYQFAAHGWRNIDKNRVKEYINGDGSKLFTQETVESVIDDGGDGKDRASYHKLSDLFEVYAAADFDEDGPHERFSLDENQ